MRTIRQRAKPILLKKIDLPLDPLELYSSVSRDSEYAFLLESVSGPEKLSEFSFIGFEPIAIFNATNGACTIEDRQSGDIFEIETTDPLEILGKLLTGNSYPSYGFRFVGGAVGYVSYESIKYWEKIDLRSEKNSDFPDMEFGIYNNGIIIDHRMGEAYIFGPSVDDESIAASFKNKTARFEDHVKLVDAKPCMAKNEFERIVLKAKEYIEEGDIFQVVLSKKYRVEYDGSLDAFYRRLRKLNPSPYMYVLKMGQRKIVGSSPEMLFRVEGTRVETFPIAGTRPITGDQELDEKLSNELVSDEKERAEHAMLVDLSRNDLGRVCRFGTVKVEELMKIHRFSHVQHMVSHVSGELRFGYNSLDVLRALFPAGTVTGAPKIRAMEIIEELENDRRGPYAGCVGYISFNGCADFAITIRTLVSPRKGVGYIQSGAGIVADSSPENEWYETEHKARALLNALKGEQHYEGANNR
jgi:anthranilate synthase component 1